MPHCGGGAQSTRGSSGGKGGWHQPRCVNQAVMLQPPEAQSRWGPLEARNSVPQLCPTPRVREQVSPTPIQVPL